MLLLYQLLDAIWCLYLLKKDLVILVFFGKRKVSIQYEDNIIDTGSLL